MIKNILAKTLSDRNMDKRDLVRLTGLDNHTVNNLFKGDTTRVKLQTLDKICFALQCDTNDVFKYIAEKG